MPPVQPDVAARIDRAEARLCARVSESEAARTAGSRATVIGIGGGTATFVRARSPLNKAIGIGFEGPIAESDLTTVEGEWRSRGARLRVELATLADAGVAQQLGGPRLRRDAVP